MRTAARLPLIAFVALLSVAAAWSIDLPDPAVFRVHLERWREMDTEQQDVLVRRWRDFQSMSEAEQHALKERMGALRRLRRRYAASHPSEPGTEALSVIMGSVEKQARGILLLDARTDVRDAVKQHQRRRIAAFLDNLVRNDRLARAERDRLDGLVDFLDAFIAG